MNNKPVIIMGMPNFHDVHKMVEANLRFCGFEVINLTEDDSQFRYPSLWARLKTQWRKHVLKDKTAKRYAKVPYLKQCLDKKLATYSGGADFALLISGDFFHPEILRYIRSKSRHGVVNYQWDGLERYPEIWQCIAEFDRFYVFDSDDLNRPDYSFLPATSFYFDHCITPSAVSSQTLFFAGSHQPHRAKIVQDFAQFASDTGWQVDFRIMWADNRNMQQARRCYPCENIRLTHRGKTYAEYLTDAQQAGILVDFLENVHNGLSLRTFEAFGYRKKLITTNHHVATYDFYHPNNIYILTADNFAGVAEFLAKPYQALDDKIYEKYRFTNWLRYVLNIEPHQKITLPQ
ncbi:hypothetical protein MIS33_05190 [Wielerella bovis]|uniref:hypothetical protein n=1 Tax=Wielerella bovis TaxID=2917790 RepID=UPI0020189323|nr:hypothetical protein [Wielerella bovis]ULJ65655.1 hypothetical protein MIS33_05190 [Wielerella bovis]